MAETFPLGRCEHCSAYIVGHVWLPHHNARNWELLITMSTTATGLVSPGKISTPWDFTIKQLGWQIFYKNQPGIGMWQLCQWSLLCQETTYLFITLPFLIAATCLGERGLKFLPAGVVKSKKYHPFSVSINTPPAKEIELSTHHHGKSPFLAIFNSYISNYQRIYCIYLLICWNPHSQKTPWTP